MSRLAPCRHREWLGLALAWALAFGTILLPVQLGQAGEGDVPLRLVTNIESLEGFQAQRPVWSPGPTPLVVHEMTDRVRKTLLRRLEVSGSGILETTVPGASSSRLSRLGAGGNRADTGVSWWGSQGSFFFIRSVEGSTEVMFFDGAVRSVPGMAPGRPLEVMVSPSGEDVYVAVESNRGVTLVRRGVGEAAEAARPIYGPSKEVSHALRSSRDGRWLHFIGTDREETQLRRLPLDTRGPGDGRRLEHYELLSLAVPGSGNTVIAYARKLKATGLAGAGYDLIEVAVDSGRLKVLASEVFLPPGLAPPPAVSHGGLYVYFIRSDPRSGNPVIRLDLDTGAEHVVPLPTRGHQEVSVGTYRSPSGKSVAWIGVVAVGADNADDVGNHLYIGPLGLWSGW